MKLRTVVKHNKTMCHAQEGISLTAYWQSRDSYLWAGTPTLRENLSNSLYGTATFSGIALWDSNFNISSEFPGTITLLCIFWELFPFDLLQCYFVFAL